MEEATKVLLSQWGAAGVCLLFCAWLVWWLLSRAIPAERDQNRKDTAAQRTELLATIANVMTTLTTNEQANRQEFQAALKNIQDTSERRHSELRQDIEIIRRAVWEQQGDPTEAIKR